MANVQIGGTYSFEDVSATINGPGGGAINLGADSGSSEEGVVVEMIDAKNTMNIGADGFGMHSLHAGRGSVWRIRLLKTSPINALLSAMYNYQQQSSAYWGQNVISMRNNVAGDAIIGRGGAFNRLPPNVNAKDGGMMEWVFDVIQTDQVLGDYEPIFAT